MSDVSLNLAEAAKELGVGTSRLAALIRDGWVYAERLSFEKPYGWYIRGAIVGSTNNWLQVGPWAINIRLSDSPASSLDLS